MSFRESEPLNDDALLLLFVGIEHRDVIYDADSSNAAHEATIARF